jgi:hypothetical protein
MKNQCKKTRANWEVYKRGVLPDVGELQDMKKHLQTCPACQAFAHEESLSFLLGESYKEKYPEPSADFFTNLERNLETHDTQGHKGSFSEIVLEKGWRLVPVMTLLIIFLMGSIGYQYTTLSKLTARSSFEEIVLFEDSSFEESDVLAAIVGGEVNNGK